MKSSRKKLPKNAYKNHLAFMEKCVEAARIRTAKEGNSITILGKQPKVRVEIVQMQIGG